ncbi:MAG: carbamate kinase [Thermoplasmata archaeon]|nr:carbamate kinase [Thermoplasmata archaeon]
MRHQPGLLVSGASSTPRRGRSRERVLVALGGNAIQRAQDHGTWAEAVRQMRRTTSALADVTVPGRELVITHGNGPQVGSLLREAELGAGEIPVPPLHVVGAETEGQLGYLIAQELGSALRSQRVDRSVLPIVSRVEVSPRDPAFRTPSKPVGRFYPAGEALSLRRRLGWTMREDVRRGGWRRLVASPRPLRWLEGDAVREVLEAGFGERFVFVVTGGGGIPVVRRRGRWEGVDAVIDKDRAAALVGRQLEMDTLAIITDVPGAALDYKSSHPRWLGRVGLEELTQYWKRGEFAEGSMGPKVEAGIRFLRDGGRVFLITDIPSLPEALAGRAGTRVEVSAPPTPRGTRRLGRTLPGSPGRRRLK